MESVGDHVPGEVAFSAVAGCGGGSVVCVEKMPTHAKFRLEDTAEVEAFPRLPAAQKF